MPPSSTQEQCRRGLIPTRDASEPFWVYETSWNICVWADRKGHMGDQRYLMAALARAFGKGLQDRPEYPMIQKTVRDYCNRRAKAQGPLRLKHGKRLKTVPVVGEDATTLAQDAYQKHGIDPTKVVHARLRRMGRRFALNFTRKTPVPDQLERLRNLKNRLIRRSDIEEVGYSTGPEGVDVMVTNTRVKKRVKLYHFAVETVIVPGFALELHRCFSRKANTVALDESRLPLLSGALRSVNSEIRRRSRSQQAVGAIGFGLVSTIREEAQEAITYAKSLGLETRTLRTTLRGLRSEFLAKCPYCGGNVALKLDPQTLIPTGESEPCDDCNRLLRVGYLLATRASSSVLYDYIYSGHTPRLRSDRDDAAPDAKIINITTTTTTKKTRAPRVIRWGLSERNDNSM